MPIDPGTISEATCQTYEGKTLEQLKRSGSAILGVTTKLETKLRPHLIKDEEDITSGDLSYLRTVEMQLEKKSKIQVFSIPQH